MELALPSVAVAFFDGIIFARASVH